MRDRLYTGLCYGGPLDRKLQFNSYTTLIAVEPVSRPYATYFDPAEPPRPIAAAYRQTRYDYLKLWTEYGEFGVWMHESTDKQQCLMEVRTITNLCRLVQGWRRPLRWRVQALENQAGTGWHVTYHDTLASALAMVEIRLGEPGISTATIEREQPWTNTPKPASNEGSEPSSSSSSSPGS